MYDEVHRKSCEGCSSVLTNASFKVTTPATIDDVDFWDLVVPPHECCPRKQGLSGGHDVAWLFEVLAV